VDARPARRAAGAGPAAGAALLAARPAVGAALLPGLPGAGAALLAALLLGGCGDGRGGAAPDGPTASPPGSPAATAPAETAGPDREPPPTSTASPAAPPPVEELFLTPAEATAAESPGWAVDDAYDPQPGPLVDLCGDGDFPRASDVLASGERRMTSEREAGGSELVQEVFRYSSPAAAGAAWDDYAAQVERCPERPAETAPEITVRSAAVPAPTTEELRRVLVREVPCTDGEACTEHFATYLMVAQTGELVTAAAYGIGEDGDPQDAALALLDALADRLRTVAAG
jgi:hypothetical protein